MIFSSARFPSFYQCVEYAPKFIFSACLSSLFVSFFFHREEVSNENIVDIVCTRYSWFVDLSSTWNQTSTWEVVLRNGAVFMLLPPTGEYRKVSPPGGDRFLARLTSTKGGQVTFTSRLLVKPARG